MQLTKEQIQKFRRLHANHGGLSYTDSEIAEIATGLANYFLTLLEISRRTEKNNDSFSTPASGRHETEAEVGNEPVL